MTDEEPVEEVVECPGCVMRRLKIEVTTADGKVHNVFDVSNPGTVGLFSGTVDTDISSPITTNSGVLVNLKSIDYFPFKGKCMCVEEECVQNTACYLTLKVNATISGHAVSTEWYFNGVCGEEVVSQKDLKFIATILTDAKVTVTFTCTACGTENTPGGEIPVPGCC